MIPGTFAEAFTHVKTLVEKFQKTEAHYLSPKYQEAEVRQEFLDKFFVALGWDVYHDEQSNPYEREVRIEKSVMVQGRGKRADYAFYTAPNFSQARFMAEAKKPSRQLENAQDCFQAIRYGWNSNTPIAVLTDFEQFLVLDSRYKPSVETSTNRIIKKFSYKDFADEEKFREIYFLFSREAVGANSLEDFANSLRKGKGARQAKLFNTAIIQPIDEEFLAELDEQRVVLAKAFKNRNADLDGETLTEITQRTLDRLVFLRFLEDKLVEPDSVIDNLGKKSGSAWRDFIGEMPRLNQIYNGTLFRTHTILDNPNFAPDERAFEQTRDWLAHVNSPYDFNSIPIHILGSIYERFLGKTIETTDKRATVVDKPEVRKAGGVYYTPEYIVRYIVANTIGKLIEKKKPEEIAAMRFADIACGSGSFLLGVFDYLIAYHVEYYSENKTRREKAVKEGLCRETIEGNLQLTIQYKREILLNNIYGVDLDAQAVEVAQLSLYLKLLEEETTATKQQFLAGFREQLLPKLDKNIVDGNSLIDRDVEQSYLIDIKGLKKLNPMNFAQTFPEVFKKGGFDTIVGNPPYIRIQIMQEFSPITVEHLKRNYISATRGNYDIYVVFVEKALSLLKENGKLGYILPHKFFNAKYGEALRGEIAKGKNLSNIVHFGDKQVFSGATTYTCLLFLDKNETDEFEFVKVDDLNAWRDEGKFISGNIKTETATKDEWNFSVGEGSEIFDKLQKMPVKLGDIADIFVGLQTSADDVFILDFISETPTTFRLKSKSLGTEIEVEKDLFFPIISGVDVKHYFPLPERQYVLFPYDVSGKNVEIISLKKILRDFPKTFDYLQRNKKRLEDREKGKLINGDWHGYIYLKNMKRQNHQKICVPRLVDKLHGAFDVNGNHFLDNVDVGGVTIKFDFDFISYDLRYLLGLINSKLFVWYFPKVSAPFRGGFFSANRQFLSQLPIRTIDFGNSQEKAAHDRLVELVEKMLGAKKSLAAAQIDRDKTFYERLCASLDAQIDALVYELYALTPDEIKIIENS